MDVVRIFDTTLRDGEQSPGFSMNTEEKIRLARQLAALNVDVIEAGFPIASRGDLEAVKKVAQEVRNVPIAALARAKKQDVDAAIEALSDADIQTKTVDRGSFAPDVPTQFHIYREAQLIFYAKATCYLRALEKTPPPQMASWIG